METEETPQIKDRQLKDSREKRQLLHHHVHFARPAAAAAAERIAARRQINIYIIYIAKLRHNNEGNRDTEETEKRRR